MLDVGDRIETEDGKFAGELIHLEDGTAYVELDNGVEMEFRESDLQLEGTAATQREEENNLSIGRNETDEVYDGTFAALPKNIKKLGERMYTNVQVALNSLSTEKTEQSCWSTASSFQKLNNISMLLGVRTEKLVSMYKNKESYATLELTMYAALGATMGAM